MEGSISKLSPPLPDAETECLNLVGSTEDRATSWSPGRRRSLQSRRHRCGHCHTEGPALFETSNYSSLRSSSSNLHVLGLVEFLQMPALPLHARYSSPEVLAVWLPPRQCPQPHGGPHRGLSRSADPKQDTHCTVPSRLLPGNFLRLN